MTEISRHEIDSMGGIWFIGVLTAIFTFLSAYPFTGNVLGSIGIAGVACMFITATLNLGHIGCEECKAAQLARVGK